MRVAIHGHVSTGHQAEHRTIEQQLGRLLAHVRVHAADGQARDPAHLFRDDGCSGAVLARPRLDRPRDAVKGREVDRVLVTAPDRLARDCLRQMVLLEEWARVGCAAEFLDRPMSDDPHDHLPPQIRGAVAAYERTLIARAHAPRPAGEAARRPAAATCRGSRQRPPPRRGALGIKSATDARCLSESSWRRMAPPDGQTRQIGTTHAPVGWPSGRT